MGRYHLLDGAGHHFASEDFRCAPGPMGWRYVSTVQHVGTGAAEDIVDLAVDAAWRPVRLRLEGAGHTLLVGIREDRIGGLYDGRPMDLPWDPSALIHYRSPCFFAVAANRLSAVKEPTDVDAIVVDPATLVPLRSRHRYAPGSEEVIDTPAGKFRGRRWTFLSVDAGERALWVAGDVVLWVEGLVELASLEPGATGPRPLTPA